MHGENVHMRTGEDGLRGLWNGREGFRVVVLDEGLLEVMDLMACSEGAVRVK